MPKPLRVSIIATVLKLHTERQLTFQRENQEHIQM